MLLGSSAITNYTDSSCTAETTYAYQVSAVDKAGNESAKSTPVPATTPAHLPPVLSFGFEGGVFRLIWTNAVLQQASELTGQPGDWSDVPGATNPYEPPMTEPMQFYRLR